MTISISLCWGIAAISQNASPTLYFAKSPHKYALPIHRDADSIRLVALDMQPHNDSPISVFLQLFRELRIEAFPGQSTLIQGMSSTFQLQ